MATTAQRLWQAAALRCRAPRLRHHGKSLDGFPSESISSITTSCRACTARRPRARSAVFGKARKRLNSACRAGIRRRPIRFAPTKFRQLPQLESVEDARLSQEMKSEQTLQSVVDSLGEH